MTAINPAFEHTTRKSSEWVNEVMVELGISDSHKALRALRAGLHAIRDRLPAAEVADLAAQLPMLLRGLYYEGWRPNGPPQRLRNANELYDAVRVHLDCDRTLRPEAVIRAVVRVLSWHVSDGELDDITRALPRHLAEVWEDCFD